MKKLKRPSMFYNKQSLLQSYESLDKYCDLLESKIKNIKELKTLLSLSTSFQQNWLPADFDKRVEEALK